MDELYNRIVVLIENAKRNVAVKVNNEMTFLYWNKSKAIIFESFCIYFLIYDTNFM